MRGRDEPKLAWVPLGLSKTMVWVDSVCQGLRRTLPTWGASCLPLPAVLRRPCLLSPKRGSGGGPKRGLQRPRGLQAEAAATGAGAAAGAAPPPPTPSPAAAPRPAASAAAGEEAVAAASYAGVAAAAAALPPPASPPPPPSATSSSSVAAVEQAQAHASAAAMCLRSAAPVPRSLPPAANEGPWSAAPLLASSLLRRVGHIDSHGRLGNQAALSYQVQVSSPADPRPPVPGAAAAAGLPSPPARAARPWDAPGSAAAEPSSTALRLPQGLATSARRVDVPWALFPYMFDLMPAVDGIPCDGLLMLGKLVALMGQSGFRLRSVAKCAQMNSCMMIELHGPVPEDAWRRLEDRLWIWGTAVLSGRVPIELSPNRSLILDMMS